MEGWALVVLLVLGIPIVVGIWLIVRAFDARQRIEELTRRLARLETDFIQAKEEASAARAALGTIPPESAAAAAPQPISVPAPAATPEAITPEPELATQ